MSSALQDPLLCRSATSALAKAPHGARNGAKDLTNSIWVLENASSRVKSMKATKLILGSKKASSVSPSQGLLSSSGDPRVQDYPFPELHDPAETTIGSAAVEVGRKAAGNTPEKNVFTTNSPISATDSALTLISTDDHTNERHSEYTSTSTEPPPPETSVPLLSYPGDEFETQLNQQLHILIPNKEVRGLISYIITSLKKDCSETRMHLACAKLISRTGRLMKLLSKQQEEKVAQAQWDTEQWKSETYINKSSGVSSNQKAQGEPRDHTQEVPGHSYNKKLILAISVTVTPVLLIIILCLIEICSHRTASGKDEEGSSSSDCGPRGRYSVEKDSQEGFSSFSQPLWRWYLRRPLSLSQQHSMAKKLHHKDSSSKDERVIWEASEISSE
ncbi:leucine-rich repeat-containing protein 37A2-like [Heterocephalus glaber]|uniref:Leucine-rich repeat-containing protein 37A2-like n=1 Tax=Heterocephalus glaber TaxID=10181 RepID=A0AAX6SXV4_HETGA|nr:leucine-rich repeat-containing protein 37A2-like [Heterocephalus glaber]